MGFASLLVDFYIKPKIEKGEEWKVKGKTKKLRNFLNPCKFVLKKTDNMYNEINRKFGKTHEI